MKPLVLSGLKSILYQSKYQMTFHRMKKSTFLQKFNINNIKLVTNRFGVENKFAMHLHFSKSKIIACIVYSKYPHSIFKLKFWMDKDRVHIWVNPIL